MINHLFINNIFIYISENCNLKCDYCYFKDKKGRTLDFDIVKKFIDFLYDNLSSDPKTFIISGGEPLLCWSLLKKVISHIRKKHDGVSINIQTNGLLLDKSKIYFLRENNINLEIGIDGVFDTVHRHRKGTTQPLFDNLISNIKLGLKKGINISCNMTVHPEEAANVYDNFTFLSNLGLKTIDVTPAALINWDHHKVSIFKKQYLRVVKDNSGRLYTQEDSTFIKNESMDFSLHPPNYVFCGDCYLCIPEERRKRYNLFTFDKDATINKEIWSYYLSKYKAFFNGIRRITYHDYVSASFKIVESITEKDYFNSTQIIDFHNFQKKVHLIKKIFN